MLRKLFVSLLMIILFSANLPAASTSSQLPAPAELIGKIKDIHLPADQMRSLSLDMRMSLPLPLDLVCYLRYEAPQNYSLKVFDAVDQTPILIICDQTAMINDPLAEDVSVIASCGIAFELLPQNGQYSANFSFNTPEDGIIKNRIDLDFKTLFSRVTREIQLEKGLDSGTFLFSGITEQNSSCSAVIDPQIPFILKQLNIYGEENPVPVLSFPKIEFDAAVSSTSFIFPHQQLADCGVKILKTRPDGVIDSMAVAATVMKAVFARSAIRNPDCREKIESMLNSRLDWGKLAEKDRERSAILRKVFLPPSADY